MSPITQRGVDSWNCEVDAEMVRLIESGVPPHEAARRAQNVVSARRRAIAAATDEARFKKTMTKAGF